jgi:hypothetical protein
MASFQGNNSSYAKTGLPDEKQGLAERTLDDKRNLFLFEIISRSKYNTEMDWRSRDGGRLHGGTDLDKGLSLAFTV